VIQVPSPGKSSREAWQEVKRHALKEGRDNECCRSADSECYLAQGVQGVAGTLTQRC
jgi:hypothetical protein